MEEDRKKLTDAGYAIIRDIIKFSEEKGLQSETSRTLYSRLTKNYQMGFICEYDYPDENADSMLYKIEIEDNYIVLTFPFISMMVSYEYTEEYLWDKWRETRHGIKQYIKEPELNFIREKGLGIKIKVFAGIGGEGYYGTFATVFTPQDIQLISNF